MRRPVTRFLATLAGAAALAPGAAHAQAVTESACPKAYPSTLECGTVEVPRSRVPEAGDARLRLPYASTKAPSGTPVLFVLAGGPGQAGRDLAVTALRDFRPLIGRYRLVTLDTRGTGATALRCRALDGVSASAAPDGAAVARLVSRCAEQVGPSFGRDFGTGDTVADLDALRVALAAPRVALAGTSYGSYVALRYAAFHPDKVDALILDSPLPPEGQDALQVESLKAVSRVLGQVAGRGGQRVRAATAAIVRRLTRGPIRGSALDGRGVRRRVVLRDGAQLFSLLVEADLNPALRGSLPAALDGAARGDLAPLMRLVAVLSTTATADPKQLSTALNLATVCQDVRLPYDVERDSGLTPRLRAAVASANALPVGEIAPLDRRTAALGSLAVPCAGMPPHARRAFGDVPPTPDVRTLVLQGADDLRTPLATTVALDRRPQTQAVVVRGTGHDVLGSDPSGCARRAIAAFAAGRDASSACARTDNRPPLAERPPIGLSGYRAPGRLGLAGRVAAAAAVTLSDALRFVDVLSATAPTARRLRAGGLRSGALEARAARRGAVVTLRGYGVAQGVRVSGTIVTASSSGPTVRVDGPGSLDGTLRFRRGSITGRIGDRQVRLAGGAARAAAATLQADPLTRPSRALAR